MFSFCNFSSIFPVGQLTPFAPMCGRPCVGYIYYERGRGDRDGSGKCGQTAAAAAYTCMHVRLYAETRTSGVTGRPAGRCYAMSSMHSVAISRQTAKWSSQGYTRSHLNRTTISHRRIQGGQTGPWPTHPRTHDPPRTLHQQVPGKAIWCL